MSAKACPSPSSTVNGRGWRTSLGKVRLNSIVSTVTPFGCCWPNAATLIQRLDCRTRVLKSAWTDDYAPVSSPQPGTLPRESQRVAKRPRAAGRSLPPKRPYRGNPSTVPEPAQRSIDELQSWWESLAMDRREFAARLVLVPLAASGAIRAQPRRRVYRIGVLGLGTTPDMAGPQPSLVGRQ